MDKSRIVVLGAGLQGASIALALAKRGHSVTVIEKRNQAMRGSSHGNEGKMHLGFVYALDTTGATQRRMLEGALTFAPLLDSWCGSLPWEIWRSKEFVYAVMPDTIVSADILESSYENLRELLSEVIASFAFPVNYIGRPLSWLWQKTNQQFGRPFVKGVPIEHLYNTEEVAVDPESLANTIVFHLNKNPLINLRCNLEVEEAQRHQGGFRLQLRGKEGRETLEADFVANCTWVDRIRLDRTVGIDTDSEDICYRVKYKIHVSLNQGRENLAPVTMVQGPYGDVVPLINGLVYLSWYPECRTYFNSLPPSEELNNPELSLTIAKKTLQAMTELYPVLKNAELVSVKPCVIVAKGKTDIQDTESGLHKRATFGARSYNGWWSVDTGKLTTAPLIGELTAEQIHRQITDAPF